MIAEARSLEDLIADLGRHEPAIAAKVRELGAARVGELMQRGFEAFRLAMSKAFDTMKAVGASLCRIPGLEKWIAKLDSLRRYARGQRKKKPRGWRAKKKSRVAWALFLEVVRVSERQREAEALHPMPAHPVWAPEQPSFGANEMPR